ncbi:hypothetical protein [Terriglobus saanensis]|nr:hypothetical protein [Terriglobus saanensis]
MAVVSFSLTACIALAQDAPKPLVLRVVDGRNGSAVVHEDVNLWYDEMDGRPIVLRTDDNGVAVLPPPLSPAVRIFVVPLESIDCRKPVTPPLAYSLRTMMDIGISAENGCGAPLVRRRSGELVLFVRGRRWYDGVNK